MSCTAIGCNGCCTDGGETGAKNEDGSSDSDALFLYGNKGCDGYGVADDEEEGGGDTGLGDVGM